MQTWTRGTFCNDIHLTQCSGIISADDIHEDVLMVWQGCAGEHTHHLVVGGGLTAVSALDESSYNINIFNIDRDIGAAAQFSACDCEGVSIPLTRAGNDEGVYQNYLR